MFEMPDRLIGTGKLAGAMNAHAFGAAGDDFAHDVSVQRARTLFRKFIGFCVGQSFFQYDVEDLGNNVARALDRYGIAFAHIEPCDLLCIMQGRVLHHDTAHRYRLELGDGRDPLPAQRHRGVEQGVESVLQDELSGDRLFMRDGSNHIECREVGHQIGRASGQPARESVGHTREIAQVFGKIPDDEQREGEDGGKQGRRK